MKSMLRIFHNKDPPLQAEGLIKCEVQTFNYCKAVSLSYPSLSTLTCLTSNSPSSNQILSTYVFYPS